MPPRTFPSAIEDGSDGRHEDALEEPLAPVLDDGDRGEDRREEDDEDDRSREEVAERVLAEGAAEAGPTRTHMTSGGATAPTMRLFCLRKRTISRRARARAAAHGTPSRAPAFGASASRKRRPVLAMKTSSSDGAPSVTDLKAPGNASTRRGTNVCAAAALHPAPWARPP